MKIAFEIDMDELTMRLAECVIGLDRPEGIAPSEALRQLSEGTDPNAQYVIECCKKQAVICWEYITEVMNKTGGVIQ